MKMSYINEIKTKGYFDLVTVITCFVSKKEFIRGLKNKKIEKKRKNSRRLK